MTQTASPEVDVRPIEVVETENLTVPNKDDGRNKDGMRHIIRPADNPHIREFMKNPTGQDVVDIAMVRRLEITALCGHKFVPSNSTEGRDTCNSCLDMATAISANG